MRFNEWKKNLLSFPIIVVNDKYVCKYEYHAFPAVHCS